MTPLTLIYFFGAAIFLAVVRRFAGVVPKVFASLLACCLLWELVLR